VQVEVITDKYGISHIYGQSPHDVYFAQGYVHAHERLWQITFEDYLCEVSN
jgi:penicillin amidase